MAETLAAILAAPDPLARADRLAELATDCAGRGDTDEQIRLLEVALAARRAVLGPQAAVVADTLDELAKALCDTGQFASARPLCLQSLEIRERAAPHHPDVAKSLDRLGQVEFGTNDLDAAEALYKRSLAIRKRKLGARHSLTANSLVNLAAVYATRGNYVKAAPIFASALSIKTTTLGDAHPDLLHPLFNLATIYRQLGRFDEACDLAARALSISEAISGPAHPWRADLLSLLGETSSGLGRFQAAHAAAREALALRCRQLGGDHPATASAIAGLAFVRLNIGQRRRARRMFQRALRIFRKAPGMFVSEIATVLHSLGATHGELGELAQARDLLQEACELYRASSRGRELAAVLLDLAIAHRGLGDDARALVLYREAYRAQCRSLGEINPDVAMTLLEIGRHHAESGRTRPARRAVLKAIAILSACADPQLMTLAYTRLAAILERGQPSTGIFFRKLAVNEMQAMRSGAVALGSAVERDFIATREASYRSLGDSLILTGRLPEAQQVLTMIKETELFELLPQNADPRTTRVSLTPLETACSRNGDRLRAAIKRSLGAVSDSRRSAPLSKGRAIARQKLNQANARLVQWLDRLIADFGRVDERPSLPRRKRSPAKVGRSARPMRDVALLQYLLEPAHLRIIASVAGVRRRYEVTFAEGEINRLVFEMRSALHAGSLDYLGSARRLHDLLIAPVIGELGGVSTLALALDGVLRYLPVAALHDGRRFLLEDFALVLTTGAARGARRPKPKQRPAQAAGLGVSRRIGSHASLPGVQEELSSVIRTGPRASGILPGVIRLDEAFTADALRNDLAGGSGVIHIASHFVFRAAEEASSYLLLGDGSKLTLHDLARLRFDDVDLMVLSACDTGTGGGHRQSGREIEGLGAMARRRGARNVVATLWPVKDFTTAALMRAFYRNRYERGLEPAEALRRAQLSFLDGTIEAVARTRTRGFLPEAEDAPDGNSLHAAHPYHWAPYMLMGDAS